MGPFYCKKFKCVFLDRFFPFKLREEKLLEFINNPQENMSMKEYALKFIQFQEMILLWLLILGK